MYDTFFCETVRKAYEKQVNSRLFMEYGLWCGPLITLHLRSYCLVEAVVHYSISTYEY